MLSPIPVVIEPATLPAAEQKQGMNLQQLVGPERIPIQDIRPMQLARRPTRQILNRIPTNPSSTAE